MDTQAAPGSIRLQLVALPIPGVAPTGERTHPRCLNKPAPTGCLLQFGSVAVPGKHLAVRTPGEEGGTARRHEGTGSAGRAEKPCRFTVKVVRRDAHTCHDVLLTPAGSFPWIGARVPSLN